MLYVLYAVSYCNKFIADCLHLSFEQAMYIYSIL